MVVLQGRTGSTLKTIQAIQTASQFSRQVIEWLRLRVLDGHQSYLRFPDLVE